MKTLRNFLLEKEGKDNHAVLAFGRFNPPHLGHQQVINKVHEVAKTHKAKHYVVLSHLHDARKNPLPPDVKLKHAQKIFPGTNLLLADKNHPSIIQHAEQLFKNGHTHLHVVAGGDRAKEYESLLKRYNGPSKNFNFKQIIVHSAGSRNPNSEKVNGMSASKMRGHAKLGNYEAFAKGMPDHVSGSLKKRIFNDVRENMGLNENVAYGDYTAVFLVGPPGSGKDMILARIMEEKTIHEFNNDQLMRITVNPVDTSRKILEHGKDLVINSSALTDPHIFEYFKEELEEFGYDCFMIYVNVSNEESKRRNEERGHLGGKIIKENVRLPKWELSQKNVIAYKKIFEWDFYLIDNSINLLTVNKTEKQLYETTISELFDKMYPVKYDDATPMVKMATKKKKRDKLIPVRTKDSVLDGVGLGPTLNTRAAGASASANAGLTDPLYKEDMMPVTGMDFGGAKSEPMQSVADTVATRSGPPEPKKKKTLKDFLKKKNG